MSRISVLVFVAWLAASVCAGKEKVILPADVLNAQTVLIVIQPEAGEPLTDPDANRRAQDDVERALTKWGRFQVVMSSQTADLIITVRKGTGRMVTPSIGGGPIDNRPVILQPGEGGDVRIGGQRGHPPDLSQTDTTRPAPPRTQWRCIAAVSSTLSTARPFGGTRLKTRCVHPGYKRLSNSERSWMRPRKPRAKSGRSKNPER